MKNKSEWIFGIGLFLLVGSGTIPMDYDRSIIAGAIGGVLTIVGVIMLVKDRRKLREAIRTQQESAARAEMLNRAAAEEKRIAEQKAAAARREEWGKTHGRIVTKIAGVTYKNKDGTSRQKALKELEAKSGEGELILQEFSYQGDPAVRVIVDGKCIGNIPADRVSEVLRAMDAGITNTRLDVESFVAEDDDGKNKRIWRADLTLIYNK